MPDLGTFDYLDQGELVPIGPIGLGGDTGGFDYLDQGELFRWLLTASVQLGRPAALVLADGPLATASANPPRASAQTASPIGLASTDGPAATLS